MLMYNILYIDDEPTNLLVFKSLFRRFYNVFVANSAEEGIAILRESDIHLIITDQKMPVKSGIEFLEDVQIEFPDIIRMVLTGYTDFQILIEAINQGKIYH